MKQKIAVQIDFDGTVTTEDVSFLLLDTYVGPAWREYLNQYSSGKITVGAFNKKVFGMIKADRKTMTDFVLNSPRVKIRLGFMELIEYCKNRGYKTVIVSNGLMFYIEALLKKMGIRGLEIHAAENVFFEDGMKVRYVGPDGKEIDTDFKKAYTETLYRQGYKVIYIGNGTSDIYPARLATRVFACDDLLQACTGENLKHHPFHDFYDVIKVLEKLDL